MQRFYLYQAQGGRMPCRHPCRAVRQHQRQGIHSWLQRVVHVQGVAATHDLICVPAGRGPGWRERLAARLGYPAGSVDQIQAHVIILVRSGSTSPTGIYLDQGPLERAGGREGGPDEADFICHSISQGKIESQTRIGAVDNQVCILVTRLRDQPILPGGQLLRTGQSFVENDVANISPGQQAQLVGYVYQSRVHSVMLAQLVQERDAIHKGKSLPGRTGDMPLHQWFAVSDLVEHILFVEGLHLHRQIQHGERPGFLSQLAIPGGSNGTHSGVWYEAILA